MRGLVVDFRESIEPEGLQALVADLIGQPEATLAKAAALPRWVSAFIAINILCSRYVDNGNLYESIKIKTYFYTNIVSRNAIVCLNSRAYRRFISAVRISVFSELSTFCNALARQYYADVFINDDIFGEFPVYAPRRILIQALCAIELLEKGDDSTEKVRDIALSDVAYKFFTHEYLVPSFLSIFWAKEIYQGSNKNIIELGQLEHTILTCSNQGNLFSSYFSLEEVVTYQHRDFLGVIDHELSDVDAKRQSQFARVLFYILAKRNYKQSCRIFWPELTNILITEYILDSAGDFGLYRSDNGVNRQEFVRYPRRWNEMLDDIRMVPSPTLPQEIREDIPALLLFLCFFPFRSTDSILLHIDRSVTKTWH